MFDESYFEPQKLILCTLAEQNHQAKENAFPKGTFTVKNRKA